MNNLQFANRRTDVPAPNGVLAGAGTIQGAFGATRTYRSSDQAARNADRERSFGAPRTSVFGSSWRSDGETFS